MHPAPPHPDLGRVQASESGGGAEGGSDGRCRKEAGAPVNRGWECSEWPSWPWCLPCPTPCDWESVCVCLSVCLDIHLAQDALVK